MPSWLRLHRGKAMSDDKLPGFPVTESEPPVGARVLSWIPYESPLERALAMRWSIQPCGPDDWSVTTGRATFTGPTPEAAALAALAELERR